MHSGHGAGFVSLGGPGGDTVPISLRAVHQMLCTGGTQQVTLDPNGAIISLGSELRCFTPNQRRAITLRDGGCVIPGCTIPAAATEIHHVTPDAEGGPTHTDKGLMLCWFHHRTITTSGWQIKMINKTPHVKAPAWLQGDDQWHPASKSPTRHSEQLRHKQRKRAQLSDEQVKRPEQQEPDNSPDDESAA
jgi:5-methylcytosine-specific restriction protein A